MMDVPTWKDRGGAYLPMLAAAEVKHGIPTDLLARIAFQESSFLPGIINGVVKSRVGAVGIMQLMPQFFPGAGISPPSDIEAAAKFLAWLYTKFNDWQVSVAAYNWGRGNVNHEYAMDAHKYILADMPTETQKYVHKVFADVPIAGVLVDLPPPQQLA